MNLASNHKKAAEVGGLRREAQNNSAASLQSRHRRDDSQAGRSPGGAPRALRIVIAGGGTGGHLFPGIAIAQEFMTRNSQSEIVFASTGNQFEQRVLSKMSFALERISVEGIKGRGLWNQTKSICRLPKGILQSMRMVIRFKPNLIVGLGSYSAGPVVLAAWLLRKKIVLHEQNLLPGITNRMLARFAVRIFVSFEDSKRYFASQKVKLTGNPVRQDILNHAGHHAPEAERESGKKPFSILIIGGSQGAHRINSTVIEALEYLTIKEKLCFVHQAGAADEKTVKDAYGAHNIASRVRSFFDDMPALYQDADLIICRAGATTVAEIAVLGKAAIFIPFPYAADNHQVLNAQSLSKYGAAEMILEKELRGNILAAKIQYYASHPEVVCEMALKAREFGNPNAAKDIVDECYALVNSSNR